MPRSLVVAVPRSMSAPAEMMGRPQHGEHYGEPRPSGYPPDRSEDNEYRGQQQPSEELERMNVASLLDYLCPGLNHRLVHVGRSHGT